MQAKIAKPDGTEESLTVAYLAGCDGARSITREQLGIGFPGGTYQHLFFVADVQATGEAVNGDLNLVFERSDFLVVFPMKGGGAGALHRHGKRCAGERREALVGKCEQEHR